MKIKTSVRVGGEMDQSDLGRLKTLARGWLWFVMALLWITSPMEAAAANPAGQPDLSFNGTGTVLTDIGLNSAARAVAIQSDGKIVVVGVFSPTPLTTGSVLVRYNIDGSLDSSFGTSGKVLVPTVLAGFGAYALAIQIDGKIVVGGTIYGDGTIPHNFGLVRYNTDGTRDASFGTSGLVSTHFGNDNDIASASALALQNDGKMIVAGLFSAYGTCCENSSFALARYNTNGTLDSSFGTGGKVVTNFSSSGESIDTASAVVIQSDGKIVVAGRSVSFLNSGNSFVLARYDTYGALDSSFGTGGKVVTNVGGFTRQWASAAAIQYDGKIVVAGTVQEVTGSLFNSFFALVRYNIDGTLDSSFGSGGEVFTNPYSYPYATATALAIQSDGKILVAGNNVYGGPFALARYRSDGSPDTCIFDSVIEYFLEHCFGTTATQGTVVTSFGGTSDSVYALAIQRDRKIVAAGGSGSDFAVARFLSDASLVFISYAIVPNDTGWFTQDVNVTLSSQGNLVQQIAYSAIGTQPIAQTTVAGGLAQFTISTEGTTIVTFVPTDSAGNAEAPHSITIRLDKTSPAIGVTCPSSVLLNTSATAMVSVTDALSGVFSQSAPNGTNTLDTSTVGTKTFTVTAQDKAGNSGSNFCTYNVVDFSLSSITPISVNIGGSASATVTVNSINGFNLPVNLTVSGLPAGVTATLSSSSVTPPVNGSASTMVTVTLSPFVTPTIFTLTVTGTTGSLSHIANETVTVIATTSSIANVIGQFLTTGCIDNAGIANALTSKLSAAQAAINGGNSETAINILSAFVNQVQAQNGQHISASCAAGGMTGNAANALVQDEIGLTDSLKVGAIANALMGYVVNSSGVGIAEATISIINNSQTVATATTDVTGFYYFATTGVLTVESVYSVQVSLFPLGYASSNPASQSMTWQESSVPLGDFILSP